MSNRSGVRLPGVRATFGLALVGVFFTLGVAPASADKCTGAKLKAIANKESGSLVCHAKVARSGDSSSLAACEAKVAAKFGTGFGKAELDLGPCPGDQVSCNNLSDTCESTVVAAMTDTFPSKC